ncbi:MAG: hypothetical protein NTZ78_01570 [Candidatus Aureabacteria bacterium]|nr:hypothetical protein [Candidatus Auribacterota bacterium]
MKKLITIALGVMLMVGLSSVVIAGSLDSPGAPSAGSGMYTLQNLYDYLTSGAALTVKTGFQEPASPPGSTMKTTREIGDDIKALYDQCLVSAADVKSGVTFFCTQPGSWGVRTGIAQLVPTLTPTPTMTPTITPTVWGSAACAAKSGYWGPVNDGSGDSGCWFLAQADEGCDTACQGHSLQCRSGAWDDDSVCTIGIGAGYCTTCSTSHGGIGEGDRPQVEPGGGQCQVRVTGTQVCSSHEVIRRRYCVCQ